MPGQHTEKAFETAIEHHLTTAGGYEQGDREAFDRDRGLFAGDVISFVQKTQPDEWAYLANLQKDKAEETLLDDLCRAMNSEHEGCLSVLRHGFKCFGKRFRVAYFAPASGMNPETQERYAANRLTITRQLRYSNRHGNTLDVTLALNGIPVATAELKNPMTAQTWRHAVTQYKSDRDPTDLIFQFRKRTLVHFAVDTDEVYMTTRLSGNKTRFLPFNKGDGGGGGNPDNPSGYKTAYLWEEVLERHSFLDILARFIHLQVEEKRLGRKKVKREGMIFPRYHQLDCVRRLVADARQRGVGTNYLVQHSAGSGKSNSIAWLAHRLASLYDDSDEKVYDSVIVVTDRVVLDQQLQNTIYQFEHKQGVVQKIDINSAQLAEALGTGVPIAHNIAQKTEVMVEHFRHFTMHKIGGKAKAMVVTSSRLHAVRYKQSFDKYIAEKGYKGIKTLVAFSGTVIDPDAPSVEYTEPGMNVDARGKRIGEKELPERFATEEYQVLLVAEKYQTGFDQPLLHTMYVDKRLAGIQAVQTLSRLNRTRPGKEDTFVLDFVNEPDEILEAFQPYYEQTLIGERADPKQLYELQAKLDAQQVYYKAEVEEFCKVFYKPKRTQTPRDHARMNACIDPAVGRYNALEDEDREEFRKTLVAYRNLYSFMSQVIPFQDTDLEKLYSYVRFLLAKLPRDDRGPVYHFDDEVALKYYRLQKIGEHGPERRDRRQVHERGPVPRGGEPAPAQGCLRGDQGPGNSVAVGDFATTLCNAGLNAPDSPGLMEAVGAVSDAIDRLVNGNLTRGSE